MFKGRIIKKEKEKERETGEERDFLRKEEKEEVEGCRKSKRNTQERRKMYQEGVRKKRQ